ncbi:MAG: methionyl-tRNA formyltransferase [Acidobacteriota bacterium]
MRTVRVAFLGTPEFAVPTLERIVQAGHEVAAVFTQPDRPKGRGQQVAAPPVKRAALQLGLPVHQPERIRTPEILEFLRGLDAEAFIVVGYGKIIPQTIIDIPPLGIINVHASLLPKYRGAAPIQWAIAQGETTTGVTTMQIDAGLDTGDILLMRETAIGPEETALELGPRLASMGADLLIETLAGLRDGSITPRKQDSSQASLAPPLKKEDGLIDWTRPAAEIHNRARGFLPWPGCHTKFRGRTLNVWRARVADAAAGAPGSVRASHGRLIVAAGAGTALELIEVQLEGKKRMNAAAFLNGVHLMHNELLGEVSS